MTFLSNINFHLFVFESFLLTNKSYTENSMLCGSSFFLCNLALLQFQSARVLHMTPNSIMSSKDTAKNKL